jgi:hypothetical protein
MLYQQEQELANAVVHPCLQCDLPPKTAPCGTSKHIARALQGTPSGPYCRNLDPPAEEAAQQKA